MVLNTLLSWIGQGSSWGRWGDLAMLRWKRREKVPWKKAHSPSPTSSSESPGSNLPGGRGGEDGGGSKRGANGEGGRLGELTPVSYGDSGRSQSGWRFLLPCSGEEMWWRGEWRWPRFPLEPHDPYPMWHIPESWEGERRGRGEWGWGREDGLTVDPVKRHLVSLPGSRLWTERKTEDRYECVPSPSCWFMAFSEPLFPSSYWPRSPAEAGSESQSWWRYVSTGCNAGPSPEQIFPQAIWGFYLFVGWLLGPGLDAGKRL